MKLERINLDEADAFICISLKNLKNEEVKICMEATGDLDDAVYMVKSCILNIIKEFGLDKEDIDMLREDINDLFKARGELNDLS